MAGRKRAGWGAYAAVFIVMFVTSVFSWGMLMWGWAGLALRYGALFGVAYALSRGTRIRYAQWLCAGAYGLFVGVAIRPTPSYTSLLLILDVAGMLPAFLGAAVGSALRQDDAPPPSTPPELP